MTTTTKGYEAMAERARELAGEAEARTGRYYAGGEWRLMADALLAREPDATVEDLIAVDDEAREEAARSDTETA